MFTNRRRRLTAAAAVTIVVLASLAACGGDSDDSDGANSITVWIVEDLADRVAATQNIVDEFTQKAGVKVTLVAIAEDQFNQVLTSNAAAGKLPDVIGGLPLGQVRTLSANKLIDTDAVGSVINSLDRKTFSDSALKLTADRDKQLAVPSESWVQLLVYRKDLFDKAGLKTPATYDDVLAAAKALDSSGTAGFIGANVAGDAFTEQTFEEIGLGNGCQLVDASGKVTFDSPECVAALDFYGQLQQNYSVTGAQDVDTTRAAYFAGKGAMLIWSSFILDEMAGLRKDALPTCPQCKSDPTFLAKNSGVVTSIQGPSGSGPATFGEITSWTIASDSATEPAEKFVNYMMTDGYQRWIAIAPEGKIPVRTGDKAGATTYSEAWSNMEVGVDTKAPLSKFYSQDVIDALTSGADTLSRWAIPQGQGDLLGAIQGEQPVAGAVNQVANGTSATEAASKAAEAIRAVQ
ncbi:MAG: extracellular solute-binding protein [Jiangellaceae bacterium]